jgi:hypothetical protein
MQCLEELKHDSLIYFLELVSWRHLKDIYIYMTHEQCLGWTVVVDHISKIIYVYSWLNSLFLFMLGFLS